MKRQLIGSFAIACATAVALGAQSQAGAQEQDRPADQNRQNQTVTVVGCLYQEKDVQGKSPNIAERAGIGEDFILTQAQVQGGSGATGTAGTGETGAPAGTAGSATSGRMFRVEGLDDEQLRQYAGQRVQIQGRIEDMSRSRTPGTSGTTGTGTSGTGTQAGRSRTGGQDDMPRIEATNISKATGSCPPVGAAK